MAFDSENDSAKSFTRRTFLLAGVQGLLMAGLLGRLYYLAVVQNPQYRTLAEENRLSLRLIAPLRGDILDRHGYAFATNRKDFQVHLIPESARDVRATLTSLGRIIKVSESDIERIRRKISRQPGFMPVTVAENLSWETFSQINVEMPDLPGVIPVEDETRYYPDGEAASHVIGFVGLANLEEVRAEPILQLPGFRIGKQGFEKTFDAELRGQAGTSRVEVNAYGKMVREVARQEGRPGKPVTLTLDLALQRYAVERLAEESAAAVVMDARSGDVVAAASTPGFDPNEFTVGIEPDKWNSLLADPKHPLVNKFLTGQYPPGSTFKMVVALAALEAGVVDPHETVYCSGKIKLGDATFHCWEHEGHGRIAFVNGISRSCDIYFYELAKRTGIERIAAMARRFGFGEAYPVGLSGQAKGLVPTPEWKWATQGERWHLGETLIAGIGQGAILATPLQLAVMTARLANGEKAVTPRLVYAVGNQMNGASGFPAMNLNPRHLDLVRRGMTGVLEPGGTAYGSRLFFEGMTMAGKTGSSQVKRITEAQREAGLVDQMELPWKDRHHALFVAYAPVEEPRYALSVLVEHGGGGARTAAPIARDIMRKTLELDPMAKPVYIPITDEEPPTVIAAGRGEA